MPPRMRKAKKQDALQAAFMSACRRFNTSVYISKQAMAATRIQRVWRGRFRALRTVALASRFLTRGVGIPVSSVREMGSVYFYLMLLASLSLMLFFFQLQGALRLPSEGINLQTGGRVSAAHRFPVQSQTPDCHGWQACGPNLSQRLYDQHLPSRGFREYWGAGSTAKEFAGSGYATLHPF